MPFAVTTHPDHVAGDAELVERYGLEIVKGALETGGLTIEALETPGHAVRPPRVRRERNGRVHGRHPLQGRRRRRARRGADRASVMDTLMTLPAEVRVLPGHTDETTIGREWEENPFVRYWRGEAASIDEAVRVGGENATLVVWSPDYDGKGKAMVRFADGREAIVGGSRVER